ncbi:MAG: dehypoxanthine futalosine cyclase [Euryarchaeota archaeon]|nr:dehypoxanthine futalosine cyclase [Euryarchaeota archaeon]OUW22572.1 MAG: hypothetical protein CBD33_01945 [Euryarchaeota archaeon TMED173]
MIEMSSWREILRGMLDNPYHYLSTEDASEIYYNASLSDLMYAAMENRNAKVPGKIVTYLVDRNINYTNICTINCHFCSFYRPPGHPENYTQSIDQISRRVSELEEIGGTRILMQGGVNPDLGISWYEELLNELSERHPRIDLDCFSPIEIEGISDVSGIPTLEVLSRFKSAGLHGLPGGGAEMLVDNVRSGISPLKGSSKNWLRIMGEAQKLGLVTSATNVFGFGESISDRVEHLDKIRELQQSTIQSGNPGFTSFISWPVMLENNVFGRMNRGSNKLKLGSGSVEYLRHVAVSRLFLSNFDHIQSSWPTMGIKVAQIALNGGADDIGSTMMEENVVSASGTTKTEATIIELQNSIIQAGYVPAKRDSKYNIVETKNPIINQ